MNHKAILLTTALLNSELTILPGQQPAPCGVFATALAGTASLSRWGNKTAAALIQRFQITASDPSFHFQGMNDDTTVNITAYVLQVNGAKAGTQPLTRTTTAVVNSLIQ